MAELPELVTTHQLSSALGLPRHRLCNVLWRADVKPADGYGRRRTYRYPRDAALRALGVRP